MQIKVNGEERQFTPPLTVSALAEQLKLNPRQVAVECNRVIVPRSQYGEQMLSEGDQIEIVHFIGGG
jgi:thiamine biosynthesis protein ThiS